MKASTLFSSLSQAALCLLLASAAHAQTSTAPGSGGPTPQSPTAVPLDGGASLLLAGGVAYGLKKLRGRRKAG